MFDIMSYLTKGIEALKQRECYGNAIHGSIYPVFEQRGDWILCFIAGGFHFSVNNILVNQDKLPDNLKFNDSELDATIIYDWIRFIKEFKEKKKIDPSYGLKISKPKLSKKDNEQIQTFLQHIQKHGNQSDQQFYFSKETVNPKAKPRVFARRVQR